ncbi:Serine/threonine-protein kinase DCLK1 [Geodia barretti]|uniref:Serine/threonine-protein kinase DCLK1 n=1 Tax=Geodia barretti TaxID=519541 RepID=A0AA35SCC3_GEOBA|nr:Serine/threonine-protein kinase DCLK1 [Geodia barretti]
MSTSGSDSSTNIRLHASNSPEQHLIQPASLPCGDDNAERAISPGMSQQKEKTSVTAGQSQRESYRVGPVVAEGRSVVVRDCHHKGTDLFDAVLHCRHFCESDATIAIRQLSMALVYLHAHKIVHRDVKLENIFLHQAGEGRWNLKLGGMGLAATASEPLSLVCGNIFYMAPEMIAETGYGTKLDVWAAGVVCCTLLSGIMPFGVTVREELQCPTSRRDFVCHLLVVSPCQRYMATQMLQHPWLEERWEETCGQRDSELSRVLMEHLVTRSATARNAALPTLVETALDKRKSLPNMNLLRRTSFKTHKSS